MSLVRHPEGVQRACVIVGRDGCKVEVDLFAKVGANPSEIIEEMYRHWGTWRPMCVGIEKEKLDKVIRFYANLRSQATQVWPNWRELKANGRSKEQRIDGLEPVARAGKLHFRPEHRSIEDQLLRYPKARLQDQIDALAYQLDIAYVPRETREPEKVEMLNGHRIVYPDVLAKAWRDHQKALRIGRGDKAGRQALTWRQL